MSMQSRKSFLRNILLGSIGASIPLNQSKAADFWEEKKFNAGPAAGVKITDVKTYFFDEATFVKIETDAGISGWGEGDHDYPKLTAAVVDTICKPLVKGQDAMHTEYLWDRMYFQGIEAGSTGLLPGAIAGVDNALWDLRGRLLKQPVHHLLGGSKIEKTAVYGSYGRRAKGGFLTPDEMAKIGANFVSQGYKTVKARMQIREQYKNPPLEFTYECIKAVRKAIGDNITLFVDFNNGYTASKAIDLGLKLYEHFNIAMVEEPVSFQDYPGLRQVVDALPCDVNAGEHEYNKWQFRDLIVTGNPDFLNLDLIKCAGITECKKVASMAQAFEKEIMVHNTRPTLATAASLNLVASITNAASVQEFSGMRPELGLDGLFHNSLKFEDGFLYIPQEPGLGLEVNEKEMAKRQLK